MAMGSQAVVWVAEFAWGNAILDMYIHSAQLWMYSSS